MAKKGETGFRQKENQRNDRERPAGEVVAAARVEIQGLFLHGREREKNYGRGEP